MGGSSYNEGRVEILYNGVWGTICSNGWSLNNAIVVCRSVGFSGANTFYVTSSQYGPGAGPIWLDNVMCDGNEPSLGRCSHRGVNITNGCTHTKDVGIRCRGVESKLIYCIFLNKSPGIYFLLCFVEPRCLKKSDVTLCILLQKPQGLHLKEALGKAFMRGSIGTSFHKII